MRAAVLGHPIAHSLSPQIYNRWFSETGFPGEYEAIDVTGDAFEATVRRLVALGYAGVNVTLPHKNAASRFADFRTAEADRVGAANLLLFRDGKVVADNTDGEGFSACLKTGSAQPYPRTGLAVVLGAGGAAAPVIAQLLPGDIAIVNRTKTRAEDLAGRFGPSCSAHAWDELGELLPRADILVNTTSLGMKGQPPLEIDLSPMPSGSVVDIVYAPLETPLLRDARARGHHTANGLRMLVYQAVPSFRAYTGLTPSDPERTLLDLEASLR